MFIHLGDDHRNSLLLQVHHISHCVALLEL